ncbi:MAG TPA: 5-dehydro-2-deoxygluconokinase [Myxococcales bacterium LLY-WYZ-16_1]|nr:5-dehydro-2-deoxygluconokinase [Myxococcales bacterium LLY-WYZ-16_1]
MAPEALSTAEPAELDLVCLGRAAVDLYSPERGASLADAHSFRKSLGGCAANVAVGAARLGLRVGMLTRVGDDPFGVFVRRALLDEGIEVQGVWDAPGRLTGLVVLAMESADRFPHLFFRERCADMAVDVAQVEACRPERGAVLLLTGTHLSDPETERASWTALLRARAAGRRVVLDLDHRPVLWGEAPVGRGEAREGVDSRARGAIARFLPHLNRVVGTEEEFCMAGGSPDLERALKAVRAATRAVLVVKRGRRGAFAVGSDGEIEDDPGVSLPVHNSLGAGDGFLAGYLWALHAGLQEADKLRYANAAGGLVVSRHACAPATPFREELESFVQDLRERTDPRPAVARADRTHADILKARLLPHQTVFFLAMDHRLFFQEAAARRSDSEDAILRLKRLIFEGGVLGFEDAGLSSARCGFVLDDQYASALFDRVPPHALVARPIEANSGPELRFVGAPGALLSSWPTAHVVKCKLAYHPDRPDGFLARQRACVADLAAVCAAQQRELLLEVLPIDEDGRDDLDAMPAALEALAQVAEPLWWKLPPPVTDAQWHALEAVLRRTGPAGVLLLGNGCPPDEVQRRLELARTRPACRGFAFGRTVFSEAARAWLEGAASDFEVVAAVRGRLRSLIESWSTGCG